MFHKDYSASGTGDLEKDINALKNLKIIGEEIKCTGEQVAGFKENASGKFHEIMLIRNAADLDNFKKKYGVEKITKEY